MVCKLEVLKYVVDARILRYWELADHYSLSNGGASSWLTYLQKQGLVVNERRNEWSISDKGLDYLRIKGVKL
jgi:predicted transcriptional regulator